MPISLCEILSTFAKLGATGFGGPIALIAAMEQECCHQRKWLSAREFNSFYVLCKMLPGPIAFQMAVWIGFLVRGRIGGVCAGLSFLFPGVLLILVLSIFYSRIVHIPWTAKVIDGMRLAALVVIAESIFRLWQPYQKNARAWIFALVAGFLTLRFSQWEPVWILGGGLVSVLLARAKKIDPKLSGVTAPILLALFWTHFKAAAFVFGTGLAVLPVLQAEVVDRYGWLTQSQFLDGIAFGQITPGPVTITSAFIGFHVAGLVGLLVSVLGMYLPGTLMTLFVIPPVKNRLERSRWIEDFRNGAIPAVIGCLAAATYFLAAPVVTGTAPIALIAVLGLLTYFFSVPAWLLIPLGSLLNLVRLPHA